MPNENQYQAIILKKTLLGEADEMVSVFSAEAGKLRLMAKSSKLSKSKLQHALQNLFLVEINTAGGRGSSLPKVIGCKIVETFSGIRESLEACQMAFFASELVYKFTPDGEKNTPLFNLLKDFLFFLSQFKEQNAILLLGLAKFKLDFLETLGLAVNAQIPNSLNTKLAFSNKAGGFVLAGSEIDALAVEPGALKQLFVLKSLSFNSLTNINDKTGLNSLHNVLSGFLHYQLERDIHSEKLLI